MSDVSGFCTSAPTVTSWAPLSRASRTSGSYEIAMSVRPASSSLSGADGSGGGVTFDVEAGVGVRAGLLRGVDAGVVRVGEVVEHHAERLGRAGAPGAGLLLLAAGGERGGQEAEQDEREQASDHGPPGSVRGVQSTTRRSSSAQAP